MLKANLTENRTISVLICQTKPKGVISQVKALAKGILMVFFVCLFVCLFVCVCVCVFFVFVFVCVCVCVCVITEEGSCFWFVFVCFLEYT